VNVSESEATDPGMGALLRPAQSRHPETETEPDASDATDATETETETVTVTVTVNVSESEATDPGMGALLRPAQSRHPETETEPDASDATDATETETDASEAPRSTAAPQLFETARTCWQDP
jgi:hypothetical protein